jgi:hypothetical protein
MAPADRQTTIRLPSAVYKNLADAAELYGSSVGEEIRRRLTASFGPRIVYPQVDEKTRELVYLIEDMATTLAEHFPPWHADEGSYRAFCTALVRWLKRYQPGGDATMKPRPDRFFGSRRATIESAAAMMLGSASAAVSSLEKHKAEAQTEGEDR